VETREEFEGFEILEVLNRGGMGVVYKARQKGLDRLVVLKVIAPEQVDSSEATRRFRREVQASARLSHPNIVTVFQTDLDGPRPFLAMEYVPGIDLRQLVEQAGPLRQIDACNYVLQTAIGLEHIHEQGLVHRDIKPANLMVTPSPLEPGSLRKNQRFRIKILDMGLARVLDLEGAELNQARECLGTPNYISPEQTENSRTADIRADLYSLGATFYFLLTGEAPFPGANVQRRLRMQLTQPAPSPRAKRRDISRRVDALVRKLLAKDPADRYQDPTELIEELKEIIRDPETTNLPVKAVATVAGKPTKESAAQHADLFTMAHGGGVQSISISADGQFLLSGGADETLKLWDAAQLLEDVSIAGDIGPIVQVALAPNAKWAVSCSLRLFADDMAVQIWEIAGRRERSRLRGPTANLRCVAVSPDGRRVAAAGEDRLVRIWAVDRQGAPCTALTGHSDQVNCVLFASKDIVVSGGNDGSIRRWNLHSGTAKRALDGGVGKISALAVGGSTGRLAFAGDGARIRQPDRSFTTIEGPTVKVPCITFSPDGEILACGYMDGTIKLVRATDGEVLQCRRGHMGKVTSMVFPPAAGMLFSAGEDGMIHQWSVPY
jgi:tRNA A-37 threonylcarbamoyl transferase component Bud32